MSLLSLLRLAFSNLLIRKLTSALTMVGLMFGSAAFIATLSATEGSRKNIQKQMKSMGTDLVWIEQRSAEGELDANVGSFLKSYIPEVDSYNFLVKTWGVQTRWMDKSRSVNLWGSDASYFKAAKTNLVSGRIFDNEDENKLNLVGVIGDSIAKKIFGNISPISESLIIKIEDYLFQIKIIGRVEPKGSEVDRALILPLSVLNKLPLQKSKKLTLKIDSDTHTSSSRRLATALIKPKFHDDLNIYDAATAIASAKKIFDSINLAGLALALISLITGGIGIMNVMLLSVAQRKKEIGLRKALGANRLNIMLQFLFESVIICLSGAMVGSSFGIGAGVFLAKMMSVEASISLNVIAISFGFCLLIGVIFGILPALKASRLDPYEALRS